MWVNSILVNLNNMIKIDNYLKTKIVYIQITKRIEYN